MRYQVFLRMEQQLDDFIRYLRFEKRYATHTLHAYERDIQQFIQYLYITYGTIENPSLVTHFHIRSWMADLKTQNLQPTSLNRKLASLRSFFKFLLTTKIITQDPAKRISSQKIPDRLPVFLKENETAQLLDTDGLFQDDFKGHTERMICCILYYCGLRRNEIMQLKEQDIEWGSSCLRVMGKGQKERLIPLLPEVIQSIKDYIREKKSLVKTDHNHLFVLENGEPLYPMFVYRTIKKYLTLITTLKKKSPHVLRHSFATHLLNRGANIQAIKELLGHSSLAATQVYTHTQIERLKSIHKMSHPRG